LVVELVNTGASAPTSSVCALFDDFAVIIHDGQLRRKGECVPLSGQSFEILVLLVQASGRLVTREQIRTHLWNGATVVEFEHSINSAIKKLRHALNDHPTSPQYIETVRRRGYRFLAPVRWAKTEAVPLLKPEAGSSEKATATLPPWRDQQTSIAVLPFLNLSDTNGDYLGDGLAEEIINTLAHVSGVKVTARTSAFTFRGKSLDIRRIARSLNVHYVLEGSVQRLDSRIRVTIQLIDGREGSHVWSHRYDCELVDLFALQDQIAEAVARALEVRFGTNQPTSRQRRPSPQAYEAYLKARHYLYMATPETLVRAQEYLVDAMNSDPSYPEPCYELGTYYLFQALSGVGDPRQLVPMARNQAEKTLSVDPRFLRAHALLGCALTMIDYNWQEAKHHFELALSVDPVSADVRFWYALFNLVPQGRLTEAIAQMERTLEIDPINVFLRINLAAICFISRMFDRASDETRRALEFGENLWMCHFGKGSVELLLERPTEAVSSFTRAYQLAGWSAQVVGHLSGALVRTGELRRAQEILKEMDRFPPYSIPVGMTAFHSICGEGDKAAEWFERAIEVRDPFVLVYINNPITELLCQSSRWSYLLEKMNLTNC
jgi:TolB-like protein